MVQARRRIFCVKSTAVPTPFVHLFPQFLPTGMGVGGLGSPRNQNGLSLHMKSFVGYFLMGGEISVSTGVAQTLPIKGRAYAKINSVAYALHL